MPDSDTQVQSSFDTPSGACDCHIHIYGSKDKYSEAPTSPFPAPYAPVSAYRQVMARLGNERAVVVQPSAYGFDNRCTLDAMKELGSIARGVVVVNQEVSDATLHELTAAGIRGIRFHMFPGGVLPWEALETMAARVTEFGWHVQLQMDGRLLHQRVELLSRLPGTLVIDHTGKFLEPVGTDHAAYQALLGLLDSGKVWVKLSAPYETSEEGAPYFMDVGNLARGLIKAAPERLVWASNWPHPSAQPNPPDDVMLLNVLQHWTENVAIARRILADNPAELYDFPPAERA